MRSEIWRGMRRLVDSGGGGGSAEGVDKRDNKRNPKDELNLFIEVIEFNLGDKLCNRK